MTNPVSMWKVCAVLLFLSVFSGSILAADADPDGLLKYKPPGSQLLAPIDSNCFVANGGQGCDDAVCESTVCALDSFCCDVSWDGICAAEAVENCEVDGVVGEDIAQFAVGKTFTDGNTMEVEVNLVCNGGLPLTQSFNISEERGVAFVLEAFQDGQPTCTVTESVPAGYEALYVPTNGAPNPEGCTFTEVTLGSSYFCSITNSPLPVPVTVDAVWVTDGQDNDFDEEAWASLECNNVAFGEDYFSWPIYGDTSYTADVYPNPDGTTICSVDYGSEVSGVESTGCEELISVKTGDSEQSCTIEFTMFFEGIPTINQYGMAILVLLMLGVGFVGFRRLA